MSSTVEAKSFAEASRIEMVDAIRGFALLGICLVHFMEYFELYWINLRRPPKSGPAPA